MDKQEVPRYKPVGRGLTVEPCPSTYEGGKRPSSYEPLVISTTVLKKRKTDEILRQVKSTVELNKKPDTWHKERRCLIPGCEETFQAQVLDMFDERLPPPDERVMRRRRNALNQAARWLLGRPATLQELVEFVVIQRVLSTTDNLTVSPRLTQAMEEMCAFLKVPCPEFTL
jgi:hypothetical protein